jgi:hypothetical protein
MLRIAALLVVVLALMAPAAAFAQGSSTCQSYNPQTCSSVGTGGGSSSSDSPSQGTLPFTGLDLGLLVGGGAMLLTAGFVVRRLSRRLT